MLSRRWVAAHGEPHAGNQLVTAAGHRLLVDWESLRLAPAELDLRLLTKQGHADPPTQHDAEVEGAQLEDVDDVDEGDVDEPVAAELEDSEDSEADPDPDAVDEPDDDGADEPRA